jgi:hypothetical protein
MILVVVIILACRFGNVVHHHLARATRIASPPSRRVHVARDQRIPGRVVRRCCVGFGRDVVDWCRRGLMETAETLHA